MPLNSVASSPLLCLPAKRNWLLPPISIMTVAVLIFVSACSKESLNTDPIKIGINSWTGYDPLILADEQGLFLRNNVLVEIKSLSSTTEAMQAIHDGEIQGVGFTLDEVFTLVEAGYKGKVVLVMDVSMGGDMVIAQKGIKSIADLKGKTIGYEGSVVGEFLLDRALSKNFLARSSVKLVDVGPDNWRSTFAGKGVDALVCFNPVATILMEEHEGNLLFSSADIPFEIIDVLYFSEPFYAENKTAITNILKGWFDALSYIDKNPTKAAKVISKIKGVTYDNYLQSQSKLIAPDLTANKSVFEPESPENIYKYSQVIVDFMMDKNLLSKRINTQELFQAELLFDIQNPTDHEEPQ